MTARLLVAPARLAPGPLVVHGDEYAYLFRARRLAVGDAVEVFDGAGREAPAVVASVGPSTAVLTVSAVVRAARPTAAHTGDAAIAPPTRTRRSGVSSCLTDSGTATPNKGSSHHASASSMAMPDTAAVAPMPTASVRIAATCRRAISSASSP